MHVNLSSKVCFLSTDHSCFVMSRRLKGGCRKISEPVINLIDLTLRLFHVPVVQTGGCSLFSLPRPACYPVGFCTTVAFSFIPASYIPPKACVYMRTAFSLKVPLYPHLLCQGGIGKVRCAWRHTFTNSGQTEKSSTINQRKTLPHCPIICNDSRTMLCCL